MGWGLGREHAGWAGPRYRTAIEALRKASVTVSSLAVGNLGGGVSNLDLSLERIASDTGGSYAKLYPHLDLALERLSRSLEGYYLLTFEAPYLKGAKEVSVKLREGRNPVHYPYLRLVPE